MLATPCHLHTVDFNHSDFFVSLRAQQQVMFQKIKRFKDWHPFSSLTPMAMAVRTMISNTFAGLPLFVFIVNTLKYIVL